MENAILKVVKFDAEDVIATSSPRLLTITTSYDASGIQSQSYELTTANLVDGNWVTANTYGTEASITNLSDLSTYFLNCNQYGSDAWNAGYYTRNVNTEDYTLAGSSLSNSSPYVKVEQTGSGTTSTYTYVFQVRSINMAGGSTNLSGWMLYNQ